MALYDVVNGNALSRALGEGKSGKFSSVDDVERFKSNDRVSVAVYDQQAESPSRMNPNQILKRERQVAEDQTDEAAYRR